EGCLVEVSEAHRDIVSVGRRILLAGFHFLHAEIQQDRLLQPLVDRPATGAIGLGHAQATLLKAFDGAFDQRPRGAFDLLRVQGRAPVPGSGDHESGLLVGAVVRRGRNPGRGKLACRELPCRCRLRDAAAGSSLFRRGLLHGNSLHGNFLCCNLLCCNLPCCSLRHRLLRGGLLPDAHLPASPSILASKALRSRAHAASSSGCLSSPVTRNTSSARAPKVAMRASCTRRSWLRRTCATSASSPGRSVHTRLSTVAEPSALGANST